MGHFSTIIFEIMFQDKINFDDYLLYDKEAILAYYSVEHKGIKVSDDVCEVFDNISCTFTVIDMRPWQNVKKGIKAGDRRVITAKWGKTF